MTDPVQVEPSVFTPMESIRDLLDHASDDEVDAMTYRPNASARRHVRRRRDPANSWHDCYCCGPEPRRNPFRAL